ncbi:hypothetical protein DWU98_12945 [Dyella monticola]|uniref:Uncharacterized protein n=1 Tax=Dyella monticola TaxID=1927958 RepID=A0A370WXU1_9GAMM|nr:hypothetical protein [Dyella monticola]RDS80847.1 hypothetical protein DWU98_12945 [Dyella monticola]
MSKSPAMKNVRRASASEAKKIEAGGKRLPGGVMSAKAAKDLDVLLSAEYAQSRMQIIERSLSEAVRLLRQKK